jgi:hypothetical protein
MFYLSDETSIKLHTADDGIIWYAAGINPPVSSNQTLDTFLLSPVITRPSTNVRILGTPRNAELIASLYARKRGKELTTICLAGPNICESMQELADPVLTLMRMRDVCAPLSCGGWHEMAENEYHIYALIARAQRTDDDWYDATARIFYESHPLYKAINFVAGVSHKDVAVLLTTIVDPRWYVDRRRADNRVKLDLYLGLTPKTQRRVSDDNKLIHRGRDLRCFRTMSCWKTTTPDKVDFNDPACFIWRIWQVAGGGAKGDLRASQAFVRYVYSNWLDALTTRKGSQDGLFMADKFFKTPVERQAFSAHFA